MFPWGTFAVNLVGCLLIGILFGLTERGGSFSPHMKVLLITGFCGGFTTFSTFAHENYLLLNDSRFWILFLYAVLSFAFGLLLAHAGHALARLWWKRDAWCKIRNCVHPLHQGAWWRGFFPMKYQGAGVWQWRNFSGISTIMKNWYDRKQNESTTNCLDNFVSGKNNRLSFIIFLQVNTT